MFGLVVVLRTGSQTGPPIATAEPPVVTTPWDAARTRDEVIEFTGMASIWPIEDLYYADTMGSMKPDDIVRITGWLREG